MKPARFALTITLLLPLSASAGEEDAGASPVLSEADARAAKPHEPIVFSVPALHTLGLFTILRVSETILFPDPFARFKDWGAHYEEAFTKPPIFEPSRAPFQWDGDHWTTNLIGHGLMGSEIYLRARHCHFGVGGALLFTTGASVLWEYGFEANGVRPSAQDLVYTPLMGLALGELRYFIWNSVRGSSKPFIRAVVDPFGELERALRTPC